ncbi:MAG: hypothetical protein WA690_04035 [Candidatus Acidiferrales bacterium]
MKILSALDCVCQNSAVVQGDEVQAFEREAAASAFLSSDEESRR